MFETILFDLDGTLSDSGIGITKCAAAALAHFGIHKNPSELTAFVGPPPTELFTEKYGMTDEQSAVAMGMFRKRFSEKGILENAPYPGVKELLRDLHTAGKRLCLATSKPRIYAQRILETDGLAGYFDIIMGSELSGERAKKTDVIKEVLRLLSETDTPISGAVMVGDRKYDVLGAKSCGLPCIGVGYGYADPGELQASGADYYAPTIEDLRALLLPAD